MVSTLAEIQTEVLGLEASRQNLTIEQGDDWSPGGHVASATYTKAFWMQARQRPSTASPYFTLSSYNGGIKHWGHDFFAVNHATGTVWKTFSLVLYNFIAGNDVGLTIKYGQVDWQAGGLYDLFLTKQQTAALDFRRAGYEIDMLHMQKTDSTTTDISDTTITLTNDGTATIGGLNVGKLTKAAGAANFATDAKLHIGDLIYFVPGSVTPTISLANTWDTPGGTSQFYRISATPTEHVIEVDRPWPVADAALTVCSSIITTGLPLQMSTVDRPWMDDPNDSYTGATIVGDDGSGGTTLTLLGGILDAGQFQPVVGDVILITGQDDITSGQVDISGLQTITAIDTANPPDDGLTLSGTHTGTTRTDTDDIVITLLHGSLSTRILQGKITLDKEHTYGY